MSVADTLASPELTGGAGFTFEDACVAVYLVALVAEETAAGLPDRVVVGVAVQQAPAGRPLDDLVVTAKAADGSLAALDLQIKRALTISAAASNHDFRSVVTQAWQTVAAATFHGELDRVGAVTGQIASDSKRALETICEWARSHATAASFLQSFSAGVANDTHRAIRDAVRTILTEIDPALGDDALHRFFRHFVLVTFDFSARRSDHPADAGAGPAHRSCRERQVACRRSVATPATRGARGRGAGRELRPCGAAQRSARRIPVRRRPFAASRSGDPPRRRNPER
ncbi:MAG: hypothetical protein WDN03_07550 [Rhizomicrobium sp.]